MTRLVYPGFGALERLDGDAADSQVIRYATRNAGGPLHVQFVDGSSESYPVESGTLEPYQSGRVRFTTDSSEAYHIRALNEADGRWASNYKTDLPAQAISQLYVDGPENDERAGHMAYLQDARETMVAFTYPDDQYIMGVLYINKFGAYARLGGEWVALPNDDDTFDDTIPYYVNPETVDQFLARVDRGPVAVTEVEDLLTSPGDKANDEPDAEPDTNDANDDTDLAESDTDD